MNQDLDESFFENALMIAGFVPVIGEIADVILIIKFLREKRYIEAGLMLFALIPTVGDFLIKPLLKMGKGVGAFKTASTFTKFYLKILQLELITRKHQNISQTLKLIN